MSNQSEIPTDDEAHWRQLLTEGHRPLRMAQMLFRHLPSPPRCKVCYNPFEGVGGRVVGLFGFTRSRKNPNLCMRCCDGLPPGGAEIDIAVLLADVRGSTAMAEKLGPSAFAARMNRFYLATTEILVRHDAIIDKLVGDEVMALFISGICGPAYHRRAAEAALALLHAIKDDALHVPIGIAVNSGLAFVGNVGGENAVDFTALGDTVNTAARLASMSGPGEVLLSEAVYSAIAERYAQPERRTLLVRGKEAAVTVYVVHPTSRAA